ncbi:ACT domain-containing protein [Clostridium vincentii]|uniref:CASTOR ACT domain-containing protein n=1 Tax=Clostridium vincentii TaxID=52704 RepID=A0A2T0BBW1_9CLOT|nr:ACT domain-containing protein [Clostridium vincentii]PRR81297.1 hypothetical protein CLVI_26160 [Clostridium vincentii]
MNLKILNYELSVCKINNISEINFNDELFFLGKTDQELSLVCNTKFVPQKCISCENGWKALRIEGELDFSLIGIISKISTLLAINEIGIFVVSTFNTDYILVKSDSLDKTVSVLEKEGYIF